MIFVLKGVNMFKEKISNSVEIRPQVTVLSVLRHLNYKPWFAIAEFIDNSIQSFIENEEYLKKIHGKEYKFNISINIETTAPGRIIIKDNAAGIAAKDFHRAFRTAQVPENRSGLSEFGMGMKSAACWFAEKWSVRTKAINETIERTILFDVNKIVQQNINSLDIVSKPSQENYHYTTIVLNRLHHIPQGRTLKKIKDHLSSIYRMYLMDDFISIKFNDEKLIYERPVILNAPKYKSPGVISEDTTFYEWKKDISFSIDDNVTISGFAALREIGSTNQAGFSLFRRGRLIVGSCDDAYRPELIFKRSNSFQSQRLFGELHLDGFEVSHTKDGFRWEHYEDIFLNKLKECLETGTLNLITQAEYYRSLPPRKKIESIAIEASQNVARHIITEVEPILQNKKINPTEPELIKNSLEKSEFHISERNVTINDGFYLWDITLRTSTDPSCEDWLTMAKDDFNPEKRNLIIDLSLAHPFSIKFIGSTNENIELLLRIATACSISLVLTEELTGDTPEYFLSNLNALLRNDLINSAII